MKRDLYRDNDQVIGGVFVVLLITVAAFFNYLISPGMLIGHSWDFTFPETDLLAHRLFDSVFIQSNPINGTNYLVTSLLVSHTLLAAWLHVFGVSIGVKLLYLGFFITSYLSMAYLMRSLGLRRVQHLFGILYAFSPFVFSVGIGGSVVALFSIAATPAFIALCINYCHKPKLGYLLAALIVAQFSLCMLTYFLWSPLVALAAICLKGDARFDLKLVVRALQIGFGLALTNLHWLMPLLFDISFASKIYGAQAGGLNQQWINSDSGIFRTLMMTGFLDRHFFSKILGAGNLVTEVLFYGHLLLLWGIAIRYYSTKPSLRIAIFLGILVVAIFVSKGFNPPFVSPFQWLLDHTPFGIIYRSPQNVTYFSVLVILLFLASGMERYLNSLTSISPDSLEEGAAETQIDFSTASEAAEAVRHQLDAAETAFSAAKETAEAAAAAWRDAAKVSARLQAEIDVLSYLLTGPGGSVERIRQRQRLETLQAELVTATATETAQADSATAAEEALQRARQTLTSAFIKLNYRHIFGLLVCCAIFPWIANPQFGGQILKETPFFGFAATYKLNPYYEDWLIEHETSQETSFEVVFPLRNSVAFVENKYQPASQGGLANRSLLKNISPLHRSAEDFVLIPDNLVQQLGNASVKYVTVRHDTKPHFDPSPNDYDMRVAAHFSKYAISIQKDEFVSRFEIPAEHVRDIVSFDGSTTDRLISCRELSCKMSRVAHSLWVVEIQRPAGVIAGSDIDELLLNLPFDGRWVAMPIGQAFNVDGDAPKFRWAPTLIYQVLTAAYSSWQSNSIDHAKPRFKLHYTINAWNIPDGPERLLLMNLSQVYVFAGLLLSALAFGLLCLTIFVPWLAMQLKWPDRSNQP